MADGEIPVESAPSGTGPVSPGVTPSELRQRLGMTPTEFADALDLTDAELRDWEEGRAEPDRRHHRTMRAMLLTADAVARSADHQTSSDATATSRHRGTPPADSEITVETPGSSRRMSVSAAGGIFVSVTPEERRIIADELKSERSIPTYLCEDKWFNISNFAQDIIYTSHKLTEIKDKTERRDEERRCIALSVLVGQLVCEALFDRTIGLLIGRVPPALKDLTEGSPNSLLEMARRNGRPPASIEERTFHRASAACVRLLMQQDKRSRTDALTTAVKIATGAFGKEVSGSQLRNWLEKAEESSADRAELTIFIDHARAYVGTVTGKALEKRLDLWLRDVAMTALHE